MPKCKEGYRSKRVDKIMRSMGNGITILDVAQSLSEHLRGSSDGMSSKDAKKAVECLKFYQKHWLVHNRAIRASNFDFASVCDKYDSAVLRLIRYALAMYRSMEN